MSDNSHHDAGDASPPGGDLPEPPVPADCDLRNFSYLPVEISRMLDSDLFAESSGSEFKAAVALYLKSFHQVPAGSLPPNDRVLARLSGAGAGWGRVKRMALRGWREHSDGRLYHATVTEKVMGAWKARIAGRERTSKATAKRQAQRRGDDVTSSSAPNVTGDVTSSSAPNVTYTNRKVTEGKLKGEEEKNPIPPESAPTAPARAAAAPFGARDDLWNDGCKRLMKITGLPERRAKSLLGKLLRDAGDDCALLGEIIREAEAQGIGDPVPWIAAAIRTRTSSGGDSTWRERLMAEAYGGAGGHVVIDSTAEPVETKGGALL